MPDSILINPVNRWLASGGTTEFFNYGLTADPQFSIQPARALGTPHETHSPAAESTEAIGATEASSLPPDTILHEPAAAATEPPHSTLSISLASMPGPDAAHETGSIAPSAASHFMAAPMSAPSHQAAAHAEPAPGADPSTVTPAVLPDLLTHPAADALHFAAGPGPALGAINQTAGDAVDSVHDLLGGDPAGGIATLISLVTITDILDLRDAGLDPQGGADPAAMLDQLATDLIVIPDPLLAETHDAQQALGDAAHGAEVPAVVPIDPPSIDHIMHGLG